MDKERIKTDGLIQRFRYIADQLEEDADILDLADLNDKIFDILEEAVPKKGYVYVIYVGEKLYKIGKTFNLERRLKELEENRIVRIIRTNDIGETETHLHNKFGTKRLTKSQELFKLNDEDLLYLHQYPDESLDDNISLF